MAQDPAFLLYYKDIIVSCTHWDADEVGWYTRLICHQADKPEGLEAGIEELAALAGVKFSMYQKFVSSWESRLSKKFEKNEQGLFINIKQSEVLQKRKNYKEDQAEKGLFGYYMKLAKQEILGMKMPWEALENPMRTFLHKNISKEASKEQNQAIFKQTLEKIKADANSWAISIMGDAIVIGNANTNTGKGGAGGKGFGNIENSRLWESEKNSFLQGGPWIYKFCVDKKITPEKFDSMAAEFISDVELKEDFKNLKELRAHFTNWFNLKSKNSNKNGAKSTTVANQHNTGLNTLLERGNEKFASARGQNGGA